MPIHASTQMTIHTLDGALIAKELGFSRVVLSRECTLEQIKYITANAGIETEVFVHGALCMCYSGQCYLSAVIVSVREIVDFVHSLVDCLINTMVVKNNVIHYHLKIYHLQAGLNQ